RSRKPCLAEFDWSWATEGVGLAIIRSVRIAWFWFSGGALEMSSAVLKTGSAGSFTISSSVRDDGATVGMRAAEFEARTAIRAGVGPLFQCGPEIFCRFIGPAALKSNQSSAVKGLWILRAELERIIKTLFRPSQFARAHLCHAQLDKAFHRIAATQGIGQQFGLGSFGLFRFVLREPKTGQVVMSFRQIMV